ncbi:hypothetical protein DPX16_11537 [Anabarilius grahami]|uniref:Uncharacterized protein n=1 Tax=Anabarilius grahami TaxID=495550 RepID=A0A3N0YHW3_ANAGA|nr:hypothetical protein DPX16_11537 [Anabarilius grahami]
MDYKAHRVPSSRLWQCPPLPANGPSSSIRLPQKALSKPRRRFSPGKPSPISSNQSSFCLFNFFSTATAAIFPLLPQELSFSGYFLHCRSSDVPSALAGALFVCLTFPHCRSSDVPSAPAGDQFLCLIFLYSHAVLFTPLPQELSSLAKLYLLPQQYVLSAPTGAQFIHLTFSSPPQQ